MDGKVTLNTINWSLTRINQAPELFQPEDDEDDDENNDRVGESAGVGVGDTRPMRSKQTDVYALGMVRMLDSFAGPVTDSVHAF